MQIGAVVVQLFTLFFSLNLFANYEDDFDAVQKRRPNLESKGTICEELAVLQLKKEYPHNEVYSGIVYGDRHGAVGELDLVVLDRNGSKAIVIGEVKCWKDFREGLSKAKEQRKRFFKTMSSAAPVEFFYLKDRDLKFTKNDFDSVSEFISIGPKGAKSLGYDVELEYSLEELMSMRVEIMRCQHKGQCLSPIRN